MQDVHDVQRKAATQLHIGTAEQTDKCPPVLMVILILIVYKEVVTHGIFNCTM